jgi:hypothetical protein
MHPGSVIKGDEIWVMGGFDDPDVWDDIVRATVSPDGTVSEWTPAGQLPGPRSHMAVTLVGDDVYLLGGLEASAFNNPPELAEVWHGKLGSDGTIGEWAELAPMPAALATHASFFYGGYLYVGGGIMDDGGLVPKHEKRIWRAPIQSDGGLGTWEETPATFGVKRGHVHQLPVYNHHVYSFAGAINFDLDSTTEIDIGSFQ